MPHWRASHQVDTSVFVRNDTAGHSSRVDIAAFRGRETVTGKARFLSKKPQNGLRYKIVVLGSVETKIVDNASQSLSSNASYETHTFLSYPLCEYENSHTTTDVELPFVLNLQDLPRSAYRTISPLISQQLLPTLDSKHANRHWSNAFKSGSSAHYSITYTVVASALAEKKVISSAAKRFHYMPAMSTTPTPFPVEDYPEEYILRANKFQQHKGTRLGVISQEPTPLIVSAGTWHASSNIELLLILASAQQARSRPTTYSVGAQLRTLTFVMREPGTPAMHTIRSARNIPIIRQEKSNLQIHSGTFEPWDIRDSSSDSDDESQHPEEISTNTVKVPFSVGIDSHFTPGFWSPLLSRRHTIDLSITLDDDLGSTTKLRLPLQVCYSS